MPMRYFRRLPPLLRVASIVGLLFLLAILTLMTTYLLTGLYASWEPSRVMTIALNLIFLSGACSYAVERYSIRFRRPDRTPFALDSWQSQVRAIALLSALPLCAIVLALRIPVTSLAFVVVILASALAGLIGLVAFRQIDPVRSSRH